MAKKALVVDHVSMKFNLSEEKVDSIKEYIIRLIRGNLKYNEFWALRDVSFTLNAGDRLGILGLNGAGKSTLLKVIAGVFKPTEGVVRRYGKVVPLLELGAGFDKQYTGRENIYLYGAVLGYSRQYIDEKFEAIVKFSGLRKFIDVPIKNYSSGMKSKLGFAIATIAEPEILILDEVLSVGDVKFRRKSMRRIKRMMAGGTTVLFVSHSTDQVRKISIIISINNDPNAPINTIADYVITGDMEEVVSLYEKMNGADESDEEVPETETGESIRDGDSEKDAGADGNGTVPVTCSGNASVSEREEETGEI